VNTLFSEAALIGVLLLFLKVAAQERLLMVEHPAKASLVSAILEPRPEVVRVKLSLYREEAESISLRLMEGNGAPVEEDDTMQGLGNRVEESLLCQVRNDGVVDLKQAAVLLLSLTEYLFCLFPLRNIDEGDHCAQGSVAHNNKMRPILYGKARAVPSPIDLIVSVDVLTLLKA
jgi:hypothetical protein